MAKYTQLALTNPHAPLEPWGYKNESLSRLLHRICNDRPGTVDMVARTLGIKVETARAQITGVTTELPFQTLQATVYHADHPELSRLYAPSGLLLVKEAEPSIITGDYNKEITDISISLGHFASMVRQALEDGRVTHHESKLLFQAIGGLRKEIAEVEALLRSKGYQG